MLATHVPAGGRGGGMVRYAVELARSLHRDPRVELHVVSSWACRHWWAAELGDPARVHAVTNLPAPVRSVVEREGTAAVLRGVFDVVHGTKHLLPRRAHPGATKLLTVHDMLPLDRPGDFGRAKRTLLRAPYLSSIREADLIVTVSAATAERLCSYVPEVAARIHVAPLAVSAPLLTATTEPIASLAGRRFVLMVGDQSARKNLRLVVGAWPRVLELVPDSVLAIAGPPGWSAAGQLAGLAELVARGSVQLLGHVSEGELRWAYESCAAVAFPSLLEGFGLPAVEARALAAPLVISEDPALNEASGGYGLTRPGDRPHLWAQCLAEALTRGSARTSPAVAADGWSWPDTASATVAAVLATRDDIAPASAVWTGSGAGNA